MKPKSVAVVGAAETTKMGRIPDVSVIGLHADAENDGVEPAHVMSLTICTRT